MTRRVISLKAVATLAVGLIPIIASGCGSSAGGTSETQSQLTRSEFITKASALCQKGVKMKERRLRSTVEKEGGKGLLDRNATEVVKLVEDVALPAYAETISELRRLRPPAKDEAAVKKVIGEYEAALRKSKANPRQLAKIDPFVPANEAAAKYGLEGCAF